MDEIHISAAQMISTSRLTVLSGFVVVLTAAPVWGAEVIVPPPAPESEEKQCTLDDGDPLPATCHTALQSSDFNRYDVVADGRLHLAELDKQTMRCLTWQLSLTNDRTLRGNFIGAMQNALWERVQKLLKQLSRCKHLKKETKTRLRYLLRHAFSDRIVRGKTTLRYRFNFHRLTDQRDGGTFTESLYLQEIQASGRLYINFPLQDWRFKSTIATTGVYYWGVIDVKSTNPAERAPTTQKRDYPGLSAYADTAWLKRNNRFSIKTYAAAQKYWNPLADRVQALGKIGGEVALCQPLSTAFNLNISGYWREVRYAPPLDPAYNTKQSERGALEAETSYQFGLLGAVATYDYNNRNTDTTFYTSAGATHAPALLAHLKFGWGYLRFGGGGGVWWDRFELFEETEPTRTKGAQAHGRVEGQWEPAEWASWNLRVNMYANRSRGDFNGWYPSTVGNLKGVFALHNFSFYLTGGWYAFQRDLEHLQSRISGWSSLNATYHPTDEWIIDLEAYGGATHQKHYQSFKEGWWGMVARAGLQILSQPDLWMEVRTVYHGYQYAQDDLSRDKHALKAALFSTIKL
jgi:hypothetical protein